MSKNAGRLSLGALPRAGTVKLTVALPSTLHADLERYAAVHAQTYGEPVDVATLIPHMLQAFIARDRAFRHSK
ncbi:DUF2274 domain-containing protein [Pigmentiphaga sp.]|uniref:DUF2274 domain-containing protein n=1 Tax=Pigmentiphaga sp. TaxID=1977564 RepID=UPI0025EC91B4|nr:DUF2274 domain-containing protein [Pigmentiphaga sp.]